jgi:putative ATP-dependent endonuclease of the OLD family
VIRIVYLKVQNFRGIKSLEWSPSATVNCLIGPGDSCKTTVLDAIELTLGQRAAYVMEDSDFYDLDVDKSIEITVTLAGLPVELKSDARYGLHLRGWDHEKRQVIDEPDESLEDAISIRVYVDKTLEPHWSIYNTRVDALGEEDRPSLRYKDAQNIAPTRLGPYAERHLSWSRSSILNRLGGTPEKFSGHLASAGRAARESFRKSNLTLFDTVIARVQHLAKYFMVRPKAGYAADLDIRGVNISAGGIALHDGQLPLRRLGTGSARLIVAALQSETSGSRIALVDELEHGLEPYRIARLLKYLNTSLDAKQFQLFITSHSPVVIRELQATDIFATLEKDGVVTIQKICTPSDDGDFIQKQVRREPEAFLAKSVLVCEGRTEVGMLRVWDSHWIEQGKESFAYLGIAIADGEGSTATEFSIKLLKLGYRVLILLDTDKPVPREMIKQLIAEGAVVVEWDDSSATEHRVIADVPWEGVGEVIRAATKLRGDENVIKRDINNTLKKLALPEISQLPIQASLDSTKLRHALGTAAVNGKWFKSIDGGEELGKILKGYTSQITHKPIGQALERIRRWADS